MRRRSSIVGIAILLTCGLALPHSAIAHAGPPFPILVDQPIPGYRVSVWADPDVGEAMFYIVLEPTSVAPAAGSTGSISSVEFWTQPVSGRLPKAVYSATRGPSRNGLRFDVRPLFDAADRWTVGIMIHPGDGTTHRFVTQVDVTLPGLGRWDLLIYLLPFILFGSLWWMALIRRREPRLEECSSRQWAGK